MVTMLRILGDRDWKIKLDEFKKLVKSLGYEIVGEIVQTKERPKAATLFGKGKIEEIKNFCEENNVDVVMVYNVLKSIQKLNLELSINRPIMDRYEVTLGIFAENASDKVSKLQIELARIEKEIPYIKLQTSIIHQRDKPYIRAGGEYGYSPKLAELRRRRRRIKEKIEELRREKINQILKRKELGFKIATFVGYYNAGKTSLFNLLTGANKRVSDMPFTTLESKYSRLIYNKNILLVDTIGFVMDLDPRIIKSFEINVDDMRYADLFLFTIDVSDSNTLLEKKFNTVVKILKEIGALNKEKPIIILANKIDLLKSDELDNKIRLLKELSKTINWEDEIPILLVSAKKKIGIEKVVYEISKKISDLSHGDATSNH